MALLVVLTVVLPPVQRQISLMLRGLNEGIHRIEAVRIPNSGWETDITPTVLVANRTVIVEQLLKVDVEAQPGCALMLTIRPS